MGKERAKKCLASPSGSFGGGVHVLVRHILVVWVCLSPTPTPTNSSFSFENASSSRGKPFHSTSHFHAGSD